MSGNAKAAPLFNAHQLPQLQELLTLKREQYQRMQKACTVVFTNGCFDMLHVGHIRYLQEAAQLGDLLITAINSDSSARILKGEGRPWQPAHERAEIIAALRWVDYVILFEELHVGNVLLSLKPDIHAKGTDYTIDSVPERSIVATYGGRVAITGDPKNHSSTELFSRIGKKS